jgi:hypothetical protein
MYVSFVHPFTSHGIVSPSFTFEPEAYAGKNQQKGNHDQAQQIEMVLVAHVLLLTHPGFSEQNCKPAYKSGYALPPLTV